MNAWPDDKICERIGKLWSAATRAINTTEGENAFAALKRLQADHGLTDAMVAYIGESHTKPVDDANVFDVVLKTITGTRVILNFEQSATGALWGLHTYVYSKFLHTPRLLVQSYEPGCGKSAFGFLMCELVHNPFFTSSTSPAAIYYQLRQQQDTSIIADEIENSTLWDHDKLLLSVFDAGWRDGGCATRVDLAKREVIRFPAFAPLMLIGLLQQQFAPQLLSRAITIHMEMHPEEGEDEIRPGDARFVPVRAHLLHWASGFQRPQKCELPRILVGRAANNWRPLIEIADTLGYPSTARAVATAMHQPARNPVVELLWDIRRVRELPAPAGYATDEAGRATALWTEDLLTALYRLSDSHWDEFGLDEGMAPRKLGRKDLLRMTHTKQVRTRDVWKRIDGKRVSRKGFYLNDFARVWHALFGDTPTQASKIISLPRHSKRHSGDTGNDLEEEIA